MNKTIRIFLTICIMVTIVKTSHSEDEIKASFYDIPPRWLVDMPTAGTLTRGYFNIGVRFYPNGGTIGSTDIGLSNRFMLGISYGAEDIISNNDPSWNPRIEFNIKFGVVDEVEYFPAITVGFSSQGSSAWNDEFQRYTFKSRGFYAVTSRSFYFYQWTSGWHFGVNYSLENEEDNERDINFFGGLDATFKYNLALIVEYDAALNDNRSTLSDGSPNSFGGKGRGYLNLGIKWLFAKDLEIEILLKDLFINRRESKTFTREIRLTYTDKL
ncbi:MAG: hypothetical protein ACE5D6_05360 [Candidatus Zixiibacteriota bacterium]